MLRVKTVAGTHQAIHIEEADGSESWQLGVESTGNLVFLDSGETILENKVTFLDGGGVEIATENVRENLFNIT